MEGMEGMKDIKQRIRFLIKRIGKHHSEKLELYKLRKQCPHDEGLFHHVRPCAEADTWDECNICGGKVEE